MYDGALAGAGPDSFAERLDRGAAESAPGVDALRTRRVGRPAPATGVLRAGVGWVAQQAHLWSPVLLATALVAASAVAIGDPGLLPKGVLLLVLLLGLRYLVREFVTPLRRLAAVADSAGTFVAAPAATRERRARSLRGIAEELEGRLAHLTDGVLHDALTGLANRTRFQEAVRLALGQTDQVSHSVAVLFIDLDHFKVVNDSLGHAAGDQLLIGVADRLRACMRAHDLAARMGGDEFTVLLPATNGAEDAIMVAERLLREAATPFSISGQDVYAGMSVGIAIGKPGRDNPGALMGQADMALYRAKASGRNRWALFDAALQDEATGRLRAETELRRALQRGEFRVLFQPIVSLASWRVVEVEALLHWQHPERGLISAGSFLALAEEVGLIEPLGRWAIAEACRQLAACTAQYGERAPLLCVNLSPTELQGSTIVADLAGILRRANFHPSRLQVEITEVAALGDSRANLETLNGLKQMGIRVALDDFGTGFSSLSSLRSFPIDTLKIDRSFVRQLGRDPRDQSILSAIIALAKNLGIAVVAEGIETEAQATELRALGCGMGQGYYFARPMTATKLRALLAALLSPVGSASA